MAGVLSTDHVGAAASQLSCRAKLDLLSLPGTNCGAGLRRTAEGGYPHVVRADSRQRCFK
jgi:hypothetical protein